MGVQISEYRIEAIQVTFDAASVAANTTAAQNITIPGLLTTDVVLSVSKPSLTAGLGISGWRVSAANTLTVTYNNNTAGALDPASELYTVVIMRPERFQSAVFNP